MDASAVPTKTFENFLIEISLDKDFLNVYRPPSTSIANFFEQFQSLLENIHLKIDNLVIIRNFSIHLEMTCLNSKDFHSFIESFDLMQKANFPTHIHGHTLELVRTKSNNDNISYVHTTAKFYDHFSISFTLILSTHRSPTDATVTFCKYLKIDKNEMKINLFASELLIKPS